MTFHPAPGAAPLLPIPDTVARLLRDLVHERTGVYFDDERLELMLDKLKPRAHAHSCLSFLDYYYILKYEEKGPEEWRRVMDAFSVQETYFWREFDQVKALVDAVVPEWFSRQDRPLRIWSAACATGEEPYSLAMALEEAGWGRHPIEIHASDGSEAALARARAGVFRERSFRSLPPELRAKYFMPTPEGDRLRPELASRVSFRWANLVDPTGYADLGTLQVIFCRNVFIYFSNQSIAKVAGHFADRMSERGHLFIGASETLLKITDEFELNEVGGAFAYRRTGVTAKV